MAYKNKEDKKEYDRKYYKNNLEKIKEDKEQWRKANPEYCKEYCKQWRKDNSEYDKQYYKNKCKLNLKYNLNHRIRTAIYHSLKGNKNGRHWEDLVGYTLNELMKRLEKTLPGGYMWQDYLKGKLHIDHIIPIKVFNFTKAEHIDFKRCWALENLQLLPAKENIIKSNKLTKSFQPALMI